MGEIADAADVEVRTALRSAGIRYATAAILDRSDGHAITMSVVRTAAQGPFEPEHSAFLARVLPHLAAAALIRRRLSTALAVAEAPRAALQTLDRGVILVDRVARMAFANTVAARILDRRDGLAVDRGGALVCLRPQETGRLRRLIAAAAADAGAGRGLHAAEVLSLPRPSGRPYVTQILPLAPEADSGGVPCLAVRPAAVLVSSDPDAAQVPPERHLREAYGLTAAEASLALRLAEGMSLREAAESLVVSVNTAKAQLKAVYAKLDVDRQAGLVRRVLSDLGGVGGLGSAACG